MVRSDPNGCPFDAPAFVRCGCRWPYAVKYSRNIVQRYMFCERTESVGSSLVATRRHMRQQCLYVGRAERSTIHAADHLGAQAQRAGIRSKLTERRFRGRSSFGPYSQQRDQCVETFRVGCLAPQKSVYKIVFERRQWRSDRSCFQHDRANSKAGSVGAEHRPEFIHHVGAGQRRRLPAA